jgi:WD40 repeat protein
MADPSTLMEGPLIAYRVQNGHNYLLLLDIATLTFREVKEGEIAIGALNWMDSGCHLYTRGNLIDLQGNIIEKTNDPDRGEAHFQVVVLSPDKQKGARDMFLGSHTNVELDYLTLEILDRADPNLKIELAPNGGAYAYAWSPDGSWLAFTDFDANFIFQLYRASPDGQVVEQLTSHLEDPGVINIVEWSPDGQRIAYAAQAILPSQYGRGGWIGLISLPDLRATAVNPDNYQYTRRLWWDEDSDRIAFKGDIFASAGPSETQIHWADPASGTILNSFYGRQAPSGRHFSLITPVGSLDSIFFAGIDGYYLLNATTNSYEKILDDIPTDGLIRDFAASPFNFPGEESCR